MIQTDLYRVGFAQNKLHVEKIETCIINRKTLIIFPYAKKVVVGSSTEEGSEFETNDPIMKYLTEETEHAFQYSYSVPFSVSSKDKKSKRLNTKISYSESSFNGEEISHTYYSHLSVLNKIFNSFHFNNLWIQKSQNLMWLVNMIILVLACIAAFMKMSCS
jgi:hypothetical protein